MDTLKKTSNLTYKEGGSGKGSVRRKGDSSLYEENMAKIKKSGRKQNCFDCFHFNGIGGGVTKCTPQKDKHVGFAPCGVFVSETDIGESNG